MVLGTARALIELTPTITSAQLVSDLVTGRSRKRFRKAVKKRLRTKRRKR